MKTTRKAREKKKFEPFYSDMLELSKIKYNISGCMKGANEKGYKTTGTK